MVVTLANLADIESKKPVVAFVAFEAAFSESLNALVACWIATPRLNPSLNVLNSAVAPFETPCTSPRNPTKAPRDICQNPDTAFPSAWTLIFIPRRPTATSFGSLTRFPMT